MGKVQPYTEWLNDLLSKIDKVCEETRKEYMVFLEKKLRDNYVRIIDNFHSAYSPTFYKRRSPGGGGLYDLLRIETDEKGMDIGFEPSYIEMRDGYNGKDGLYTTVFLQGYHGGAYIQEAGNFLVPWTAPTFKYDGDNSPWNSPKPWEREAGVSHGWSPAVRTVSPYRLWKSFIDGYNKGQYQKDFDVIWNKNISKYF